MAHEAQPADPLVRKRSPFYGWWIVALSMTMIGVTTGPTWAGVGVWVKALEVQFGWSRTVLSGAFSLSQLEGQIMAPLIGYLIDRFGARVLIFIGTVLLGLGFLMFSQTTNIFYFYLAYAVIMVGSSMGTWHPIMTTVNHWFVRRRGTAMAIAGEGNFIGGLLLVPLLAWAVEPGRHGWSITAMGIGIVFIALAFPMWRLFRNSPEEYGQYPDGDTPNSRSETLSQEEQTQESEISEGPAFTARQAMRTRSFWYITFGHAFSSCMYVTLTVHFVPMLTDKDISLQTAAFVWAAVNAAGAIFQLVGGYVGDRMPKNVALFIFSAFQVAGLALAAFIQNVPMAFLFAVVFGIGHGGRIPIVTAIRGDYFGRRAFATIVGISMVPIGITNLVAPLFAGVMFDLKDSYEISFITIAALGAVSSVLFLLAKRPPAPVTR